MAGKRGGRTPGKRKRPRKCGFCRKEGHVRTKCPELDEIVDEVVAGVEDSPSVTPPRARVVKPPHKAGRAWKFTPKAQRVFFEVLAATGLIQRAADAAGVSSSWIRKLRKDDDDFADQMKIALAQYADLLEREMFRRGVEGVDKPVFQQGRLVGYVREYDSALLTSLAKAARPEKFRQNVKVDADVAHTGVMVVPMRPKDSDDWGDGGE